MTTYESAVRWQATRPRPSPTIRQTGRPFMTILAEALDPAPLPWCPVCPGYHVTPDTPCQEPGACLDCGSETGCPWWCASKYSKNSSEGEGSDD